LFISGDDAYAKSAISEVIQTLGFAVIDLGNLANDSKLQQAKGPLATINLIQL
jgi:8-hydroxy-5-deazaflavin:NADPH oxidoreductase